MKHLIISTIGNRDVQVKKEDFLNLPEKIQSYFEENTEAPDMYVVSKKWTDAENFYNRSAQIFDLYDEVKSFLISPLLDIVIKENGVPDKIILVVTDQKNQHHLDTVFLGKILAKKLSDTYDADIKLATIQDVYDLEFIGEYFRTAIEEHLDEYRITIHTSGGIPNFRIIAFMNSLFKEKVSVVNYIGRDAKEASVFKEYELHTLRQIVDKMLTNWNYSAILNLPYVNERVRNLCELAIARLALDLAHARELAKDLDLEFSIPDSQDHLAMERELIYSAYVKYHQKEYGDFLFRMFTFHDNMLIPHVEEILGGKIEYNRKTNHASWKALLNREENKDIFQYLQSTKIGHSPLDISEPNKKAYYKILHFCKKYSKKRTLDEKASQVMKVSNRIEQLADLRNRIAHHYKGINEEMVLSGGSLKRINDLTRRIDTYLNTDFINLPPYQEINRRIRQNI